MSEGGLAKVNAEDTAKLQADIVALVRVHNEQRAAHNDLVRAVDSFKMSVAVFVTKMKELFLDESDLEGCAEILAHRVNKQEKEIGDIKKAQLQTYAMFIGKEPADG